MEGMESQLADISAAIESQFGGGNDRGNEVVEQGEAGGDREAPAQAEADVRPPASGSDAAPAVPGVEAPTAGGSSAGAVGSPAPLPNAPSGWKPELWAAASPELQAEITKRQEDFHKGIEQYKAGAETARAFDQVIAPFRQVFEQFQMNPLQHVQNLLHTHHQIAMATPENRRAIMVQIAKSYGVDFDAPAQAEDEYVDPALAREREARMTLQKQVAELQSARNADVQRAQAAAQAEAAKTLNAFASDPAHPHFETVASELPALIRSGYPLEKAYIAACALRGLTNPAPAPSSQDASSEAAARAAAAAKAASAVPPPAPTRTKPKPPSAAEGNAPLSKLDETIHEAYAAIKARAAA